MCVFCINFKRKLFQSQKVEVKCKFEGTLFLRRINIENKYT